MHWHKTRSDEKTSFGRTEMFHLTFYGLPNSMSRFYTDKDVRHQYGANSYALYALDILDHIVAAVIIRWTK